FVIHCNSPLDQFYIGSRFGEVDSMLGGDAHDASHVGSAGLGEFLCTTRDKVLKPGRRRVHQHSQRLVARIPERMHHAPRREDGRADRHFGPDIVLEELGASLEHKKPFVLVQVIMRRRASAWRSDNGKHGILAAGFRGAKVNGNLVAKSPNDFTARWRNDAGGWSGLFVHFCIRGGLQDVNRDFDDASMPPISWHARATSPNDTSST